MRTIELDMSNLMVDGLEAAKPPLKVDPEVAVMRLKEWAERYAEARSGPRFAVGAFVTPSRDGPQHGAGELYLVVETRIVCQMDGQPQVCICSRDDMRVLGINSRGDVVPAWAESAQFETWVAPLTAASRSSADAE
jgi:hypothetical protein